MKKILISSLAALSVVASSGAFATTENSRDLDDIQLNNGYNSIIAAAAVANIPSIGTLLPVANRAGFVKNAFDFVISANNAVGVVDNPTVFGVIVGNNKGYGVYTGSSLGGSISQCGALDKEGKAAALVITGNLDVTKANGCNR